ncbi:hypothetical protein SH1V18_44050 [Vallitalea longa]|uniref:SpoIIIAH-like family protein n=1 Tax=Vallitalea longa TaxID=2936439 RepID=A0A9W5YG79_9FIRM|nr:SpoIIIAH-like family protein [Vallitalea longa]GKX31925.1 hypothetical protein SH1V18_44050 [Vallitalea longa]
MQTFKKNQIIITALVIMIAIAGYLSFTEKDVSPTTEVLSNQNEDDKNKENVTTPTALVPNGEGVENETKVDENADKIADDVAQGETPIDNQSQTDQQKQADGADQQPATSTPEEAKKDTKETTSDKNDGNVGEAVLTSKNTMEAGYFLQARIDREQTYSKLKEGYLALIDNDSLKEDNKVEAVKEMIDLQDRIEKEAAAESILEAKGFKDVFVRLIDSKVDVVINAKELSQADLAKVEDVVRRQTGVDAENIVITLLDVNKSN